MSSITTRTIKECESRGWAACIVERYNSYSRHSNDAFGFGDILAIDDDPGALLIQLTTKHNMRARIKKILGECRDEARRWLEAGNRIEVWGWAKQGPRGWYALTDTPVTLEDFEA